MAAPRALTAPRRTIGIDFAAPLAVSIVQIPKSRSKAIDRPSALIEGQSRRPVEKLVTRFGSAR